MYEDSDTFKYPGRMVRKRLTGFSTKLTLLIYVNENAIWVSLIETYKVLKTL